MVYEQEKNNAFSLPLCRPARCCGGSILFACSYANEFLAALLIGLCADKVVG